MSFSEKNIKKIVEEVYVKAEQNCSIDNKNRFANHVHEVLLENYKAQLSARTVSRVFDKYIYKKEHVSSPGMVTIDLLCMYLGYKNYQDYINTSAPKISKENGSRPQKKKRSKKTVYIIFGLLFFTSGITIVWNNYNIIFTQNPTDIDATKSNTSEIIGESEKDSATTTLIENQEEKVIEKSVKLGVFHEGDMDLKITKRVQQQLFQKYKVAFIQLPNVTKTTLQKLQQGNINLIKNKSSNYFCIGTVSYRFRQAETNTELIICELQLQYITYDRDGNFLSQFSNTRTIRANGFSKTEAQENAILKL